MAGDRDGGHTHHEEVAPSHPDDADVGEGLHDVVERGGGESMNVLRGIGRDGVLRQLPEEHPVRDRTPPAPWYIPPRSTQGVSITTEGP